jgi:hypothetical protein
MFETSILDLQGLAIEDDNSYGVVADSCSSCGAGSCL